MVLDRLRWVDLERSVDLEQPSLCAAPLVSVTSSNTLAPASFYNWLIIGQSIVCSFLELSQGLGDCSGKLSKL